MLSIGEFSKATGLTVKALRFYHEQGVLVPARVDPGSGYRYYEPSQIDAAVVVVRLRGVGFAVKEIAEIIARCEDDADVIQSLENRRDDIVRELAHLQDARDRLDCIISNEREARRVMAESDYSMEVKDVAPMLVAGVRMRGRYQECGKGFAKLGRLFGRKVNGKPMMLCYDQEYKEEDADFEPCFPVRGGESKDGVEVKELPGARCLTLMHKGPYDTLYRSYERLFARLGEEGKRATTPSREVYVKGPGLIFKGNPNKYLTEIQIPFEE